MPDGSPAAIKATPRFEHPNRGVVAIISFFSKSRWKAGEGLNAGMSCAGILIVVFFVMLRAVFSLRCLIRNVPKPRRKTFSLRICAARTSSMKPSTTAKTVVASTPVSRAICFMISALVMFCKFLSDKGKQTFELKKNSSAVQRLYQQVYCIAAGRHIMIIRK